MGPTAGLDGCGKCRCHRDYFLNGTFIDPQVIKYNVIVLSDDVSVPTSLQVVLCMSVWSVLQFQTYVLRWFGAFPCGSAVSLFSIAPLVGEEGGGRYYNVSR